MLEELELLDDEVVVVEEGLVDVLLDVVVQVWLDVEWLVGLLDLFDPHVQLVQLLVDQVLEVVRRVENTIDTTHQEREEDESNKLQSNREKQFLRCLARVVTVADSRNDFENPVESKNVLCVLRLVGESFGRLTYVDPAAETPVAWILNFTAINLLTEVEPDARVDVIRVNNTEDQASENCQIALTLFAQILQHELEHKLLRLRQSMQMENPKHFHPVIVDAFARVQAWYCGNAID